MVENKSDITALTETWLKSDEDKANWTVKEMTPNGFSMCHKPRKTGKGGGVGLVFKNSLQMKSHKAPKFKSFEYFKNILQSTGKTFNIVTIYRPPPSKANKLTTSIFLKEFSTFLEQESISTGSLLIVGDFNFHFENKNNSESNRFHDLLDTFNLCNHVNEPTHRAGHTLDLVITRKSEDIVSSVCITPMDHISDHFAVHFKLALEKPHFQRKTIEYRKYKAINVDDFRKDIESSSLIDTSNTSLSCLVNSYDKVLRELLDKHAPQKKITVTQRPNAPYYTDEIRAEKRKKRKLERQWKRTKLTVHKEMFTTQCKLVSTMLSESKKSHYQNVIQENEGDQKKLFKVVTNLLHKKEEPKLPSHSSVEDLCEDFANFFTDKITKIREELGCMTIKNKDCAFSQRIRASLTNLSPATEDEVHKIIMKSAAKSCSLDPIPSWLLKECISVLLPVLTQIVNLSMSTAVMPDQLKDAIISPLLKKASLDSDIFKHFRPVSNLTFLSKIIEKVVATRICAHMSSNSCHELFQSAYKRYHSTETALVRVQNDILRAIDDNYAVLLVLLDLSAAFDTIDHQKLFTILQSYAGIDGHALAWLKSYLTNRKQSVKINGATSSKTNLDFGVPQGSVLGPILFTIYTLPLAEIIRRHNINYHLYADDTQLYLTFKSSTDASTHAEQAKSKMEACIDDIRQWMNQNFLKLNEEKTEILLVNAPWRPQVPLETVRIGSENVTLSEKARNIGIIINSSLSSHDHVSAICQKSFYHLQNLWKIRKYLSRDSSETLVHAFISNNLDFCNSLLTGIPQKEIDRLQKVQNAAARVVSQTSKFDHITPILYELHWLPVAQRIQFKVLLLTYKALNGLAPTYISDLLVAHQSRYQSRSNDKHYLKVPKTKLATYGDRAFSYQAPMLWNALPCEIKCAPSLSVFKNKLKTHLFIQGYESKIA